MKIIHVIFISGVIVGAGLLLKVLLQPVVSADNEISHNPALIQIQTDTVADMPQHLATLNEVKSLADNTNIMQMQLASVATAFEKNIQYPVTSQPLNENSWDLLHPNEFVTHRKKLSKDSETTASVALNSYVIFAKQAVELTVTINNPDDVISLNSYHAEFISNNKAVGKLPLSVISKKDSNVVLQSNYTPGNESSAWSSEMAIKVTIDIGDDVEHILIANFKYSEKIVELIEVMDSYIDNTDLVIPLNFKVEESGRYITRANLFSLKTGKPIAHIFAKENLGLTNTQMKLSVHSSLLRDINDEGPYEIRNFDIKRIPARPGDKTGYGFSQIDKAKVNGFSLDQYSSETHVDLQAQQRLEFLQQLAN